MIKRPLGFDDIPLILTADDLTAILHVGLNAVRELIQSEQIKSTRIGKHTRILKPDLQQFLEGESGTNTAWTDANAPATLVGDSCRAATEGGDDHAAR